MPKEPPIPMLLGKIYKKLGRVDQAHYYFNLAIDLESKDTQKIKGFIESLHNSTGDGDEIDLWLLKTLIHLNFNVSMLCCEDRVRNQILIYIQHAT